MLHLLAFAVILYGCAVGAAFWLLKGGGRAVFAGVVTVACAVLSPYVIPPNRNILHVIAAFMATDLMFKVVDYLRQGRRTDVDHRTFTEYLRFLIPFPVMIVVFEQRIRHRAELSNRWPAIGETLAGAAGFAVGSSLLYFANKMPILGSCFALDHLVKLVIAVILIESASCLMHGVENWAGFETTPPMQHPFVSRTVGEFWWRWNNRVQAWLRYNVFLPVGGRRAPMRGVALSFFCSGIVHEVMIGVAASRFDGYQFTFFMVQVPAVLVSRRLERFAQKTGVFGKILVHLLTVAWFTVTSIFFFRAVDRIFPFFYVSQPWLP